MSPWDSCKKGAEKEASTVRRKDAVTNKATTTHQKQQEHTLDRFPLQKSRRRGEGGGPPKSRITAWRHIVYILLRLIKTRRDVGKRELLGRYPWVLSV